MMSNITLQIKAYKEFNHQLFSICKVLAPPLGLSLNMVMADYLRELKEGMKNAEFFVAFDNNQPQAFLPLFCTTVGEKITRRYFPLEGSLSFHSYVFGNAQLYEPLLKNLKLKPEICRYDLITTSWQNRPQLSRARKLLNTHKYRFEITNTYDPILPVCLMYDWDKYALQKLNPRLDYGEDLIRWDYCGSSIVILQELANQSKLITISCFRGNELLGVGYYTFAQGELYWLWSRKITCSDPIGHLLTLAATQYCNVRCINLGDFTGKQNKIENWGGEPLRPIYHLVEENHE